MDRRHLARRGLARIAALLVALVAVVAPTEASAAQERRPNIVVVVTDDQTLSSFTSATMPATFRTLVRRGTRFTNAIVTTPLCCPSRATLLTGQYAHNHGVLDNRPGYTHLRGKHNTLPVWLRRAGYRTAHVGKYLNGYRRVAGADAPPAPGWAVWRTIATPTASAYYDYQLSVNGNLRRFGSEPNHYVTRVLTRHATQLIRRHAPKRRPLYLQLDHLAPHNGWGRPRDRCAGRGGAVPDLRDAGVFRNAPLPQDRLSPEGRSFDEIDVDDKPAFMQALERITPERAARLRRMWRCALASLRAVDRSLERVWGAVRKAGEDRNTVIVFTSDNGLLFGEHRIALPLRKDRPYEEALRVPLMIRVPARLRGGAARIPALAEPVANIDLVPTILGLAGAGSCRSDVACRTLDGRSLLPLIRGRGRWPAERRLLVEFSSDDGTAPPGSSCGFGGIRFADELYVEHARATREGTNECTRVDAIEHYDLASDPMQLDSLVPGGTRARAGERQRILRRQLARLRDCAGIKSRDAKPPNGHYCD